MYECLVPGISLRAIRTVTSSTGWQLSEKLLDVVPIDRSQVLLPIFISQKPLVSRFHDSPRRTCADGGVHRGRLECLVRRSRLQARRKGQTLWRWRVPSVLASS